MISPQPSPASVPDVMLRCGLSAEVPQPSRRRKNSVVPALVSANVAVPDTARYGFWRSETFWLLFGPVIVTDGDAESAAAAVSAATSAASVSSTSFRLIFLPPWVGAE